MVDIVNLQFMGFPVVMYAMMLVTTGAITYATVYPINIKMPSMGDLPSLPSANPSSSDSNFPNGMPGMSNTPPQPMAGPSQPAPSQGGKRGRKTRHRKCSPKKRSNSVSKGHSKKSHHK